MKVPLRVLFVEDSEQDLAMLLTHFNRSDYEIDYLRVETHADMSSALHREAWDIIISDYRMPEFSGIEALSLAQEVGIDIPFIIVSGNIGEETAVAAMKAGAHDYIFKGNLQRLIPAITRELREAQVRRSHQLARKALMHTEAIYRHLIEHIPATVYWTDTNHPLETEYVSPHVKELLGVSQEEFLACPTGVRDKVYPEDRDIMCKAISQAISDHDSYHLEYRMNRADGSVVWVLDIADVVDIENENTQFVQGVLIDITSQKALESALRHHDTQLRALAMEVTLAEERERRRMAMALHDQTSQELAFARMELRAAIEAAGVSPVSDRIKNAFKYVDRAYQQTRNLTFELSPPILYDLGLPAAIDWYAEEYEKQHGIAVDVNHAVACKMCGVSLESKIVLFRSYRELLTNIAKHARAANVYVQFFCNCSSRGIIVRDDGMGFDTNILTAQISDRPTSFGLFSIRERIEHLGGTIAITSSMDNGTKVVISLPVDNELPDTKGDCYANQSIDS